MIEIKNILDEEVLSDEQLDNVAGGTGEQLSGDYNFLKNLGYLPEWNAWAGWDSEKMTNDA